MVYCSQWIVYWIFHDRFCHHYRKNHKIRFYLTHSHSRCSLSWGFVILNRWQNPVKSILIISFCSLYIFRGKYKLSKCNNHYTPAYYLIMSFWLETTKWGPVWVNQNTQHLKMRICNKRDRCVCFWHSGGVVFRPQFSFFIDCSSLFLKRCISKTHYLGCVLCNSSTITHTLINTLMKPSKNYWSSLSFVISSFVFYWFIIISEILHIHLVVIFFHKTFHIA